jgi:hypothetical protein
VAGLQDGNLINCLRAGNNLLTITGSNFGKAALPRLAPASRG